jgi:uncharacterized protein YjbI with pentapeptide repeats
MNITIEEIVKKINDGTLNYRFVTDTDETARGKVDLRNRTFKNTPNLIDCSLDYADLDGSIFYIDMHSVSFENASLQKCHFSGIEIESAFFLNANLSMATGYQVGFVNSTFNNTSLTDCKFTDDSSFTECEIIDCNMSNSDFRGVYNKVKATKCNLSNCKFTGDFSNFTECEFIDCDMSNSEFEDFNYDGVKATKCNLSNCKLTNLEITNCRFFGCIIENTTFKNANFERCGFYKKNEDDEDDHEPYPLFKNSSFMDLVIDSCDMLELLLEKIEMIRVKVFNMTFDESIFDNFYISESTFTNVDFIQTVFKNPDRRQLGNNTIINANIGTIIFEGDIELEDIFIIDNPYQNIRENAHPPGNIGFYDRDEPEEVEDDEEDEEYDEAPEGLSNKDKCFWPYGPYDVKITDYLTNPNHFLIQLPGSSSNYECGSLNDMKRSASLKEEFNLRENDYKGYYECSGELMEKTRRTGITPLAFGPGDFNDAVEYIQFGTASKYYVRKPEWLWDGPIPEPKKFKLIQDSPDLKYFVSKSIVKYNGNVVSDTHCDFGDNGYVYRLEPILEGGKRVKKIVKKINKNKKANKKTVKKAIRKKNNKKTIKKAIKKVKKNKKANKKTVKKAIKKDIRKNNNKKTIKKAIKKDIRKRMH